MTRDERIAEAAMRFRMARARCVPVVPLSRAWTDLDEPTADGGEIDCAMLIHPLVEPEIAFRLGRDADVAVDVEGFAQEFVDESVDAVMPALEIIDNIADKGSAARFVLGTSHDPSRAGDLRALCGFLSRARRDGRRVRAGDVVLTGGMTSARPAARGYVGTERRTIARRSVTRATTRPGAARTPRRRSPRPCRTADRTRG